MPLRLHDVIDAEAFTASVLNRSNLGLSREDWQDAHQYLLLECWLLSERYDAEAGISFSTWAGATLRHRVVDMQRKHGGRRVWKFRNRTYIRPRYDVVSLDERNARLGESYAEKPDDREADRSPACSGPFNFGDSSLARDKQLLGIDTPKRAEG